MLDQKAGTGYWQAGREEVGNWFLWGGWGGYFLC